MKFEKMHGCGNSFVLFDYEEAKGKDFSLLAKEACDGHVGIGADGLIIVKQDPLEMIFYNQDGSRAPMCGNGIRCFARYVYEHRLVQGLCFDVLTMAGTMRITIENEEPFLVKVNMGKPLFDASLLKLSMPIENIQAYELEGYRLHSVFMGTIHTVLFVEDLASMDIETIGKKLCHHALFSEQTNVNFVEVQDRKNIKIMTYERGVGLTLACGTGCCASAVYAYRLGKCDREMDMHLPCGHLHITVDDEVWMEGTAVQVATGSYHEGGDNHVS